MSCDNAMSRVSPFIFVKAALRRHRNTLLSAALFRESALRRHAAIRGNFDKNKGRHGPRADGLPQSAKFKVLCKWISILWYNNWTPLAGR